MAGFFPSTSDGGDRSGNVRAGTVVDRDIVHPTDFDFVSQPALQYPDTSMLILFTVLDVPWRSTRHLSSLSLSSSY